MPADMSMPVRRLGTWAPDIVAVIRDDIDERVSEVKLPVAPIGVICLEVALATCRGLDVIKHLAKAGGFAVGVATALDAEAAQSAIQAGTAFRLWPAAGPDRIEAFTPYTGLSTSGAPGQVEALPTLDGSADIVKLFPARLASADYIERPVMPLPQHAFIPSGIGETDAADGQIMVVGIGSRLPDEASAGRYARIREKARQLIKTAQMRVNRLNTKKLPLRDLEPSTFNRNRSTMPTVLTIEQKSSLAELVTEHAGLKCDFSDFCDYLLLLFEDIPGFETARPGRALLREIWDLYCVPPAPQPAGS